MNKKEIRIDLLPEDFINADFENNEDCPAARALLRKFKIKDKELINTGPDIIYLYLKQETKTFLIKNGFEHEDYLYVNSQYEKGTKTRYYITLVPQ